MDCVLDGMDHVTFKEISMKSSKARSALLAWGLAGLSQWAAFTSSTTAAESYSSPSLLPIPSRLEASEPTAIRTAYNRRGFQEDIPSPSDVRPVISPDLNSPTPAPKQAYSAPPLNGAACQPTTISPDYQNAMKDSWGDGCNGAAPTCDDGSCGMNYGGGISNRWAVYGGGLIMSRANQSNHALSQDLNNYNTIMTTNDAAQQTAGGFDVGLARLLGCNGCNAFQLGYWGIFPQDQSAQRNAGGYPALGIGPMFGPGLNFLDYDDGTTVRTAQAWMTTTTGAHQLRRSFNYNSAEANFLGNSSAWGLTPYNANYGCGPRLQYGWLAGFRYFQYGDTTTFYSDYDDTTIDGDANELKYGLRTNNKLAGFQMGGQANWQLNNCWSIFGGGRAGVFNNHITHTQYITGSNGDAVINAGAYTGQAYRINSSRNALAGIGQIDLGLRYNVNCRFSLNGGYRVVGIAGLAGSDGQIADTFADPRMAAVIKADQAVLLHGAFFGGTYMW